MPIDVEKGFHKGTLITCTLAITAQSIMNLIILPTLPFMIQTYFPDIDVSNVSYYSGFLLSLYYLGQIPGCIVWGWYADQHGRKKALLIISLLNTLCISGLGISTNYYVTLVIRLIHGFVDGSLNITKTMIAEISNERNLPLGTSFIFIGTAVGRFIGPLIGGYLCHPENFSSLADRVLLFKTHPFLLPFTLSALMFLVVVISTALFSEETISMDEMETSRQVKDEMKRELSGILRKGSKESINSHEQLLLQYHKYSSYTSIIKERDVLLVLILYIILCVAQMSFDSLLSPVLANRTIYGGFDMSSEEISLILVVASPIAMVTTLYSPSMRALTTYRKSIMYSLIGLTFFMFIYPIESLFNTCNETVVFSVVIVIYSTYIVFRSLAFNLCIVIVSNVSYKEFRGTIMGLSQTLGGLGRFMGPSLIPSLYAWSCHIHSFPVHHGLSFYVLGFLGICACVTVYFMSDMCDKGRGSITSTIVHKH